jgi:hypothetical protein
MIMVVSPGPGRAEEVEQGTFHLNDVKIKRPKRIKKFKRGVSLVQTTILTH